MSIQIISILIITGLIAGFFSGALGIGGAIIIIPILVYVLGMSQHAAQGTSLFLMLPPIGLLGAIQYYKQGYVNLQFALILIVAFFIGTHYGSIVAIKLPTTILKKIFGVFLIIISIKMIFGK